MANLYDKSSLVMIPSGKKDGTVFSQKPVDGSGDFIFSRGSNLAATRVGPTGLIEKGRENLFTYSNDFSNAAWIQSGTITSGQSGYDGTNNAWKFENPSITSSMYQPNTNSGVQTISAYFKKNATYGVRFFAFGSSNANTFFDLNNGVVVAQNNTIDASVEPVGTDWFRCSMTINQTNSRCDFYVTNNAQVQVLGHFTIQDAQLEIGLAATEVITTGATTGKAGLLEDEPRFDYSGGATCPSLLLEPSRTNLVPYSEYFDGTYSTFSTTPIFTTNYKASPQGVVNSTRIQLDAADLFGKSPSLSSSNYVFSFFAKKVGLDEIGLRIDHSGGTMTTKFNLSNGTISSSTSDDADIIDYGNGWYRCWILASSKNIGNYVVTAGGAPADCEIFGLQLEEGSYPTSYIPNHSGGSVTRGADFCLSAGDTSTFNDSEGVIFVEAQGLVNGGENRYISLSNNTSSNRLQIIYSGSANRLQIAGTSALNGSFTAINHNSFNQTALNKVAVKYSATELTLFVNGVKIESNSSNVSFANGTLDSFDFALWNEISAPFQAKLNQALYFPTALSDADCITLTTI